jgi:hypothetical protein
MPSMMIASSLKTLREKREVLAVESVDVVVDEGLNFTRRVISHGRPPVVAFQTQVAHHHSVTALVAARVALDALSRASITATQFQHMSDNPALSPPTTLRCDAVDEWSFFRSPECRRLNGLSCRKHNAVASL